MNIAKGNTSYSLISPKGLASKLRSSICRGGLSPMTLSVSETCINTISKCCALAPHDMSCNEFCLSETFSHFSFLGTGGSKHWSA